ncbi:CRISPR-associated endonuclease Cas2 [Candidatus Gottesmanbacteria bacterium RIFCSPHIGHO2_01_FULL_46_14]|uniref:CRISPR-associated endoribonuclease Cas2 n=1 Tax=Candidatus Gottesmanbacteria bacterium RIFCSPHIGHO2_01_FULL_46_14 TaxID=1798380 RepID=A0A1F5ZMX2_9BACT|nr:MAG: CRISPR-associated endonuclease Cas2 [Candidatus Gottesmanbacteria bacterium RIFCSPHIGHO2_01_FULL_46_14]
MGKRGAMRKVSREALALAEGVFTHAVDLALWFIVYVGEVSLPQSVSGQVWRAQKEADRFLGEINYEVIKNAINTARKRKWVKSTKRGALPQITQEGRRRLASVIPVYDEKRIWDSRLHLITYDIPEERKTDREKLRNYLRRIGCGKLQDSVWMTPYNPIDTLRSFIDERMLGGTIIISDLGQDASIGEEDIQTLLVRVYDLEKLNMRYEEWLSQNDKGRIDHYALIQFLAVLRDDPQLPFVLLPPWWKGREAYERVKALLRKSSRPVAIERVTFLLSSCPEEVKECG